MTKIWVNHNLRVSNFISVFCPIHIQTTGGLQELEKAITSNGAIPTGCVNIPRSLDGRLQVGDRVNEGLEIDMYVQWNSSIVDTMGH